MNAALGGRPLLRMRRGAALSPWRRRGNRRLAVLLASATLLLVGVVLALCVGPSGIGIGRLLEIALAAVGLGDGPPAGDVERGVLLHVRAPRIVLGAAVGAALALAGAALQALLRNPLVEPGLVGTTAGGTLGAVLWIVFGAGAVGGVLGGFGLAVAAFLGALGATVLVVAFAGSRGRVDNAVLILVGVALTAIFSAGTGFALFLADDQALRDVTFWSLGSLSRATWPALAVVLPCLGAASAVLIARAQVLDALLLGEAEARALGVRVDVEKRVLVAASALAVAAAVGLTGSIGFVGLIVPHGARMLVGAAHRALLPVAALLGAAALVLADAGARTFAAPAELPIGILTAAVGGPCFLVLLFARRARMAG
mgnify:CR=1 FL=1